MIRDAAVALIQQTLAFRGDKSAEIVTCLQLAQSQLELEPEKPWFLTTELLTRLTSTTTERVAIPTDMLIEADSGALWWVPSEEDFTAEDDVSDEDIGKMVALKKDEYDVLVQNFKRTAAGSPKAYALRGQYFIIFPTPDREYTLKLLTLKQDTVLSSNVENNWLKYVPLLMIGKAGQYIAPGLRDPGALATFKDWEKQGRIALVQMNNERDLSNRELQIGGPHV